ncbi:hypothetical protein SmJEL517_g04275 [Synchytrium microbalum]|uniref:Uncharacterized protein n=1 Tax=Synchytrium microbalum TaxID=1806994 RepID=A0A507BZS8_9FUNG|nr:uncharacterized protein SmJEL517_g04275 [Synchytrium microbalum]TPX32631.1 hypothetical protein SmJEL517_g04275 [Synchytrium microbalum]
MSSIFIRKQMGTAEATCLKLADSLYANPTTLFFGDTSSQAWIGTSDSAFGDVFIPKNVKNLIKHGLPYDPAEQPLDHMRGEVAVRWSRAHHRYFLQRWPTYEQDFRRASDLIEGDSNRIVILCRTNEEISKESHSNGSDDQDRTEMMEWYRGDNKPTPCTCPLVVCTPDQQQNTNRMDKPPSSTSNHTIASANSGDIPTSPPKTVKEQEEHDQREGAFSDIYKDKTWGNGESLSGPGSYMEYTVNVRTFLALVFRVFDVKSWLDTPCGDCNWQRNISGFNDILYTGADIVPSVIIQNGRKYRDIQNMKFMHLDLAVDDVPNGADVILCRDMLQHTPLEAGRGVIQNFEQSGAKYLVTNFHSLNYKPESGGNRNIKPGEFFLIDVMKPPYNFPPPLMYSVDGRDSEVATEHNYKMVGIWKLPVLDKGNGTILPVHPQVRHLQTAKIPASKSRLANSDAKSSESDSVLLVQQPRPLKKHKTAASSALPPRESPSPGEAHNQFHEQEARVDAFTRQPDMLFIVSFDVRLTFEWITIYKNNTWGGMSYILSHE